MFAIPFLHLVSIHFCFSKVWCLSTSAKRKHTYILYPYMHVRTCTVYMYMYAYMCICIDVWILLCINICVYVCERWLCNNIQMNCVWHLPERTLNDDICIIFISYTLTAHTLKETKPTISKEDTTALQEMSHRYGNELAHISPGMNREKRDTKRSVTVSAISTPESASCWKINIFSIRSTFRLFLGVGIKGGGEFKCGAITTCFLSATTSVIYV